MALISCLTVTRPARLAELGQAVGDFAAQTHAERELVIVHDGDAAFDATLHELLSVSGFALVRIHREPPGPLGQLRNRAVAHARGELVCQWDDDDRYHPMRLELQAAALERSGAQFCFLSDQLHWYRTLGAMAWDDWDREPYPMNLVQGTLLGRRDAMLPYPELARGEDTGLTQALIAAGRRVHRLRGAGWSYVYVHHGANAWSPSHHAAITRDKSLGAARLLARESELRRRLAEYDPPLGRVRIPYPGGEIVIEA